MRFPSGCLYPARQKYSVTRPIGHRLYRHVYGSIEGRKWAPSSRRETCPPPAKKVSTRTLRFLRTEAGSFWVNGSGSFVWVGEGCFLLVSTIRRDEGYWGSAVEIRVVRLTICWMLEFITGINGLIVFRFSERTVWENLADLSFDNGPRG